VFISWRIVVIYIHTLLCFPSTHSFCANITQGELDKRGARNLVVCGLATDYCVRATALDGLAYGYNVTLVKGACRGVNNQTIASALAEMAAAGVIIVETAADVILQ
jgi:nicotinamidase-related amidase